MQRNSSPLVRPERGWDRGIDRVLGPTFGGALSDRTRERLAHYLDETIRWGSRVDLTAARSVDELLDLSLADAGVVARAELEQGRSEDELVDVGSGGGAPGIPLLVLLAGQRGDGLRARLVEPREKRSAFLRSVVGGLGLPGIEVVRSRSDRLADGSADVALARATLPPPEWLTEGSRLARRTVWVLLAREAAPSAPHCQLIRREEYQLPLTGIGRTAVAYRVGTPDPA
ncbi:MAG TPA: RsmG family class I SAM-dependent methyltransferase [Polyangiaceae bacterium]|nr:RsmG family class I SAM-dependent methyltransferase [Polyangiaceae bacterium]